MDSVWLWRSVDLPANMPVEDRRPTAKRRSAHGINRALRRFAVGRTSPLS
jgi:hypothetical protein